MLAQDFKRTARARLAVQIVVADCLQGGFAFNHFELVGRQNQRPGRHIVSVVGAADPLNQPLYILRSADLDHEIDVSPVDAEIERAGAYDCAQRTLGHCSLDPLPCLKRQRAVVDGYRKVVRVLVPQGLEKQLRLRPRIDEYQRELGILYGLQNGFSSVPPSAAQPGRGCLRLEHSDVGSRTRIRANDIAAIGMVREEFRDFAVIADCSRQSDATKLRRDPLKPGQGKHQQIAALGFGESMDLVDHNALQAFENSASLRIGQHEAQRLRRSQQDVRRVDPLPEPRRLLRIACALFDPNRQFEFADRAGEIAADVGRQSFERRYVKRVETCRMCFGQFNQAGKKSGERFSASCRRNEKKRFFVGAADELQLVRPDGPAVFFKPARKRLRQEIYPAIAGVGRSGC